MDVANRESAIKCRELGRAAIRLGDYEKAIRMLEKGLRLFPGLPDAELLLSEAKRKYNSNAGKEEQHSDPPPQSEFRRRATESSAPPPPRQQAAPRRSSTNSADDASGHSKEATDEIDSIRRTNDYYKILGVTKSASDNDIRKAYKKLALKFHPDKNTTPGADEAFKKISSAYAVLSDEEKKRNYDQFGSDEPVHATHFRGGGHGFGGEDIDPEELFRMFFGGHMPRGGMGGMGGSGFRVHHFNMGGGGGFQQRGRRNAAEIHELSPLQTLFQNLPFIAIMLLTLSSFMTGSPSSERQSSSPTYNNYQRDSGSPIKSQQYDPTPKVQMNDLADTFFCSINGNECISKVGVLNSLDTFSHSDNWLHVIQFYDFQSLSRKSRSSKEWKDYKKSTKKWEEVAKLTPGSVRVVAMDKSKSGDFISKYNIDINHITSSHSVYLYSEKLGAVRYNGALKPEPFLQFITPHIPSTVRGEAELVEDHVLRATTPIKKVILIANNDTPHYWFKGISMRLDANDNAKEKNARFYRIGTDNPVLLKKVLGSSATPYFATEKWTVAFIDEDKEPVYYNEETKAASIYNSVCSWVAKNAKDWSDYRRQKYCINIDNFSSA